jgi:hypothetical protein
LWPLPFVLFVAIFCYWFYYCCCCCVLFRFHFLSVANCYFFFSLFRLLNNCCDLESSNRRGSWPHPLLLLCFWFPLCGSDRLNWGGASLRGSKVLSALGFLKCTCEPGSWFR